MPNIKSAIKRVKTSDKRHALNISQKSALRTAVKTADVALNGTEIEVAKVAFQAASRSLIKPLRRA